MPRNSWNARLSWKNGPRGHPGILEAMESVQSLHKTHQFNGSHGFSGNLCRKGFHGIWKCRIAPRGAHTMVASAKYHYPTRNTLSKRNRPFTCNGAKQWCQKTVQKNGAKTRCTKTVPKNGATTWFSTKVPIHRANKGSHEALTQQRRTQGGTHLHLMVCGVCGPLWLCLPGFGRWVFAQSLAMPIECRS